MKLSIAWIFEHIDSNWKKIDLNKLTTLFNQKVAEIENSYSVKIDLSNLFLGQVIEENNNQIKLFIKELNQTINLNKREDALLNKIYILKTEGKNFVWAKLSDLNSEKDGLVPAIEIDKKHLDGKWRNFFETEDIIIEVDNKTLTNRPDMWGHRGFAREIAAYLNLKLIPEKNFLEDKKALDISKKNNLKDKNLVTIENKAKDVCKIFSSIELENFENKDCNLLILSRLVKIGQRPINGLIDLTNYLMLDWSQPVHAYDKEKISDKKIIVRFAKDKEKLNLLDGTTINLTAKDLVIADNKKPLCLAGVMGGTESGITKNTNSIFLESANFDPLTVRKTSLNYKTRTESSMRFEKTLDPNQAITAIKRFLKLAKDYGFKFKSSNNILYSGKIEKPVTIEVSHEFLERKSGLKLNSKDIKNNLEKLEFIVKTKKSSKKSLAKNQITYAIEVPTNRSSKDIKIKEDILEEVIRYYGYNNIDLVLPKLSTEPKKITTILRKRKIKQVLVQKALMTEQQNYIFVDEEFFTKINLLNQKFAAEVINPVSENNKILINSMIPNLFKNIYENYNSSDTLRFFEIGKIWLSDNKDNIIEKNRLSGIFFEKRKNVDFYESKSFVNSIFEVLGINEKKIDWQKAQKNNFTWAQEYQTAQICIDNKTIGYAGKVDPIFLANLGFLSESDAFFFDIDLEILLNMQIEEKRFTPIAKYQETFIDLSLMVPIKITSKELESIFEKTDKLITKVELLDFFEKAEWADKKSLTYRLWISHPEKTLEKVEIDNIWQKAINNAEQIGAKLRS